MYAYRYRILVSNGVKILPGIPTGERFRLVLNTPLKCFCYLQIICGILVTDFAEV